MKIQFLEETSFRVDTDAAIVLIDPRDSCVTEALIHELTESRKQKFVFVSPDADAPDEEAFLGRLPLGRIHLLYPEFSHVRFAEVPFHRKTAFHDRQRIDFGDGVLDLFVAEPRRDSAIFIRSGISSFLELNDGTPIDRWRGFRHQYGSVDVLAAPSTRDDEALAVLRELLQPKILLSPGSPDLVPGAVFHVEELCQVARGSAQSLAPGVQPIERRERIEVVAGGCVYEVDRLCPHRGADMEAGWVEGGRYLVCPHHMWSFDLTDEGRCTANASTIRAIRKKP